MIFKNLYPLISCICVTANRSSFLLRAIIYYYRQNYPNKELVISYPKSDVDSKTLMDSIKQLPYDNIVVIERENDVSLGMARNEAVQKCNGEYICNWDDDDWYHDYRIINQFGKILSGRQKREACILTQVILYDRVNDQAYISGLQDWTGTLLCNKQLVLQHPYTDTNINEHAELIQYLSSSKYLFSYPNYELYAFIFHGGNEWDYSLYKTLIENQESLNQLHKDWIESQLNINLGLTSNS